MSNLVMLVTALSQSTVDRSEMTAEQVDMWARLYHDMLMVRFAGTLEDVFDAAHEWLAESRYFPTVGDLRGLVEARAVARMAREQIAAAQRDATPLPALPAGTVDWSTVATADLPPGYDYSQDAMWQKGLDLLVALREGGAPPDGLGALVLELDRRRQSFQGASKPRELVCPACKGARYVRLGGWDASASDLGRPESRYVMCAVCCPQGQFDETAARNAARRAVVDDAA